MIRKATVERLEQLISEMQVDAADGVMEDDPLERWIAAGCEGELPLPGPLPPHLQKKFGSQEAWERSNRFLVALCCLGHGLPLPDDMSEGGRRETDEAYRLLTTAYDAISLRSATPPV